MSVMVPVDNFNKVYNIMERCGMRKNGRKGPSYLDVAEFILTGPFSPKI